MSLARRLTAIADSLSRQNPQGAAALHRIIEETRATGIESRALGNGDTAPAFELQATDGRIVSLGELVCERPVILSFYRGRW